jgi:hypothetical protein
VEVLVIQAHITALNTQVLTTQHPNAGFFTRNYGLPLSVVAARKPNRDRAALRRIILISVLVLIIIL